MSDLNSYIMLKDHDVVPGKIGHQIGKNGPPRDDELKLNRLLPSKSRERKMNPSQLLINLQNFNFKQSNILNAADRQRSRKGS